MVLIIEIIAIKKEISNTFSYGEEGSKNKTL